MQVEIYLDDSNWYVLLLTESQIAMFMRSTWGPSGADRTQVGPILATWTLLSEIACKISASYFDYIDFLIPTAGMTVINARRILFNCHNNVIFICVFHFLYQRNSLKQKSNLISLFALFAIQCLTNSALHVRFIRKLPIKCHMPMSLFFTNINYLRLQYIISNCIRWFLPRY